MAMNFQINPIRSTRIVLLLLMVTILLTVVNAEAFSVTIRWDANTPAPEGYKVYVRQTGQAYDFSQPIWKGADPFCVIDNLQYQTEYFFIVRAFVGIHEGLDSDEARYVTPAGTNITTETTRTATTGLVSSYTALGNDPFTGEATPVNVPATSTASLLVMFALLLVLGALGQIPRHPLTWLRRLLLVFGIRTGVIFSK